MRAGHQREHRSRPAPLTTATGIDSAASLPAGTSMAPAAVCPGAALAVPTANGACSAAHRVVEAAIVNGPHPNTRIGVMAPPIGSDGGDVGHCQGREAILAGKSVFPEGEIAWSDHRIGLNSWAPARRFALALLAWLLSNP